MQHDSAYAAIERLIVDNINMFKVDEASELVVAYAIMQDHQVEQVVEMFGTDVSTNVYNNLALAAKEEGRRQRQQGGSTGFRPQTTKFNMKVQPSVQKVLDAWRADRQKDPSISPAELLARLLEAHPKSETFNLFKAEGVNPKGVRYVIDNHKPPPPSVTGIKKFFEHKLLNNMNKQAANDEFEPFFGREEEIEKMVRVLSRQRKPNVALVGEAGVGKTALVEGLAKRIEDGDVPEVLKNAQIVSLDVGDLTQGTKYRGDFEKRVKELVEKLKEEDDVILFIDEYHTVVGAGSASGSQLDLSNMLKPLLARGEIRMIAGTTPKEYKKTIRKDAALKRRTQEVRVEELNEGYTIMACRKSVDEMLSKKHGVEYDEDAIVAAVRMSKRYMPEGKWPDSPLDILDDAGAHIRVKYDDVNERAKQRVDVGMIMQVIAENTGIETARLDSGDGEQLKGLTDELKKKVFNQDEPVEALSRAFKRANAGMGRLNGPMGVYVFAGPTGVGKTETAKALAEMTGMHFARFDMTEYAEEHSVARLKGAPPGYVGHDDGGQLTEEIRQHPYSVILLDEIEKAHPEVLKLFLPTFDDARMTDGEGNTVDFRNTFFILTTNLKNEHAVKRNVGFNTVDDKDASPYLAAIKQRFPPELYNRVDDFFEYSVMDKGTARLVLDKFIKQRADQLFADRAIELNVTDAARDFIVDAAYDAEMGGRPMNRAVDKYIATDEMTDAILFTDLKEGGAIKVDCVDGALKHDFNASSKKATKQAKAVNDNSNAPAQKPSTGTGPSTQP